MTGQAGSGKTTAIKALIKALQDIICEQVPVLAPTGTAAQLVGAKTGAILVQYIDGRGLVLVMMIMQLERRNCHLWKILKMSL